jgi:hypothetical protein
MDRAFEEAGRLFSALVKADKSFGGNSLRNSIRYKLSGTNKGIIFTQRGKRFEHASYVNDGTRAHRITAKNGKALKFQSGGSTIFRRSVWHPGTKATKFFDNAADRVRGQLPTITLARVKPAIDTFNR